ncbi:MAG TPA: hypothetical protein VMS77_04100 [Conexivisphaerales archaeon]|nr:hypothetical protein [Conexivisphaerales archaeon]
MPPPPFSRGRRALSTYFAVLVLISAALGLSMALYEGYSSSFRLAAPAAFQFSYRSVDSGKGFEQVTAQFQFDRDVVVSGLLLNGTWKGYLSLGTDGNYVPAAGGIEFFSVVLPAQGTLTVTNVSSAVVDGYLSTSYWAARGRHSLIVVASGNYSLSAPSFSASRESGVDPMPFASPDDLTKPSSSFSLLLPLEPGSTLAVTLLYSGGTAEGVVYG